MIGSTQPLRPLPLSGILAIAGVLASLCVLAIPPASATSGDARAGAGAEAVVVHRVSPADAEARLRAVGREVAVVLSAVETVAATASH